MAHVIGWWQTSLALAAIDLGVAASLQQSRKCSDFIQRASSCQAVCLEQALVLTNSLVLRLSDTNRTDAAPHSCATLKPEAPLPPALS